MTESLSATSEIERTVSLHDFDSEKSILLDVPHDERFLLNELCPHRSYHSNMMSDNEGQERSQSFLPPDVTFPHEQNAYLKVKIQDLENENARLKTRLSNREKQLEKAQKQLESKLSHCFGTSEIAATKVAELSKRIRELNSDLESEKSKSRALYNQLLSKNESEVSKEIVGPDNNKELEAKLAAANAKIADLKSECKFVRQEMKTVQKIIHQEIGEDISVSDLVKRAAEKGWKGRAQTIAVLSSRVTALKAQLAKAVDTDKEKNDTKHSALQKAQEENENTLREKQELMEKCKLQEEKLEASKARRDSLMRDVKALKQQLANIMGKFGEQEKTTEIMNNKLRHLEEAKKKLVQQLDKKTSNDKASNVLETERLRKEVQEKNIKIEELLAREEKLVEEIQEKEKEAGNATLYKSIIKEMNDLENKSLKSLVENLNKRIGELTSERIVSRDPSQTSPSKPHARTCSNHTKTQPDSMAKLSRRLKTVERENDVLKETVQRTIKAKEEDIQLFYTLLEQTRKLFFESLNIDRGEAQS